MGKRRTSIFAYRLRRNRSTIPYDEMQATLTVCDFPSMSSPLIIYMKNFLSTAERPQPLFAFPEVVFHEVMHKYLRRFYNLSTLRKKYASEAPGTVGQLHLMALEKFVLQKLKKNDVLKWVDIRYRTRLTPAHKRAWEIVNEIEGHEAFIRELASIQSRKIIDDFFQRDQVLPAFTESYK